MQSADRAGRIIDPARKTRFFDPFASAATRETCYRPHERVQYIKSLFIRRVELAGLMSGDCAEKGRAGEGDSAGFAGFDEKMMR
jgi:hypothetical protein